ncbi:unnamed protein product [Schistocephalus solidus]|uniref:Iron-sulfur cluster assembly 1 homolog, mitochondrial n=1 Tax=Schistocephalus solidus TaxID=70667 RepID=A0A0V0J3P4_SCHSO|nr:unnamed protein product [Schistocephalus solidus]
MNHCLGAVSRLRMLALSHSLPNFQCSSILRFSTIANSVRTTYVKKRLVPQQNRLAAITLTPAAVIRVRELLKKQPDAQGLRIGLRTRGCTGLSYTLTYCTEGKKAGDEVVEQDGVRVFIDRRAQLTLLGTEMDFQSTLLSSEFVFNNPNVTGTCGCGESFSV